MKNPLLSLAILSIFQSESDKSKTNLIDFNLNLQQLLFQKQQTQQ